MPKKSKTMEDWQELQNLDMRKQIAEGHAEYRRGKTKPLGDLLAELRAKAKAE